MRNSISPRGTLTAPGTRPSAYSSSCRTSTIRPASFLSTRALNCSMPIVLICLLVAATIWPTEGGSFCAKAWPGSSRLAATSAAVNIGWRAFVGLRRRWKSSAAGSDRAPGTVRGYPRLVASKVIGGARRRVDGSQAPSALADGPGNPPVANL
jgi:hypothetical protein